MSQHKDDGYGSVVLTEAVAKYERVNAAGELCGITERGIGFAMANGAIGDEIGVALHSKQGSYEVKASAALAVDAIAYTAASGKVGASASTAYQLGIVLSAASADGDIIEVMPIVGDTAVS